MSESPAGWTGLADLRRASALALALIAALAGSLARRARQPRAALVGRSPAATRPPVPAPEELRLHVFTLQHQRAIEALAVIRPLLSVRGAVDLDETANTLAVRDTLASLSRVTMAMRAFDHAAQPLRFEVQLVHAETSAISPVPSSDDLDPALLAKLKQLLRFQHYALIGRAAIDSREGEQVTYQMGDRYRLVFRVGTVVDDRGCGSRICAWCDSPPALRSASWCTPRSTWPPSAAHPRPDPRRVGQPGADARAALRTPPGESLRWSSSATSAPRTVAWCARRAPRRASVRCARS